MCDISFNFEHLLVSNRFGSALNEANQGWQKIDQPKTSLNRMMVQYKAHNLHTLEDEIFTRPSYMVIHLSTCIVLCDRVTVDLFVLVRD